MAPGAGVAPEETDPETPPLVPPCRFAITTLVPSSLVQPAAIAPTDRVQARATRIGVTRRSFLAGTGVTENLLHEAGNRSTRMRGPDRSIPGEPRKKSGVLARRYSIVINSAISIAATAASKPLLPAFVPARSTACSMVSVVSTPKMTGMPLLSDTWATPFETSEAT